MHTFDKLILFAGYSLKKKKKISPEKKQTELGDDKTNTAKPILACNIFFRMYILERCNHIHQIEETNLIFFIVFNNDFLIK